jgi:phosphoenolpyruvate carboxykinase (GTP)
VLAPGALEELLEVDTEAWRAELPLIETHYELFGDRLPQTLRDELDVLAKRLADRPD